MLEAWSGLPSGLIGPRQTNYAKRPRCRGSLLRYEVRTEETEAPLDMEVNTAVVEQTEAEWTEDRTSANGRLVDWDSDWEADHVVLRCAVMREGGHEGAGAKLLIDKPGVDDR